jgi:hypothetical protein
MSLIAARPLADCFLRDASEDDQHGERCYCGRRATVHIHYGSGCGHVCGVHKRSIEKVKGRCRTRPLEVQR